MRHFACWRPLAALPLLLVLAGCLPAVQAPGDDGRAIAKLSEAEVQQHDAEARAALYKVALALEQYAIDHQDHYPPTETWVQALVSTEGRYLPDGRLPASPWAHTDLDQANSLPLDALASYVKQGVEPVPGTVLGPVVAPVSPAFEPLTAGAMLYRQLDGGEAYQLAVIGQEGDQAIVAGAINLPVKRH